MATTNHERISKAMEELRAGLAPFVEREIHACIQGGATRIDFIQRFVESPSLRDKPIAQWDVAGLLRILWEAWNDVFKNTLGRSERSLVSELRDVRNKWAHQDPFSSDDAYRALDSMERLLNAISATEAEVIGKSKQELLREVNDKQVRNEKRKPSASLVESALGGVMKPWREVVTPHDDVASGRYQQAEFAADLWQVHLGQGADEYRKPNEFFRRTYLTESLKGLLVAGVKRLSGTGGDPVVQLQTNFGGGKTHSMLALYHLFSGVRAADLPGADEVMASAKVVDLPKANIVVLVGNKISPGNPSRKPDGTIVRTLWGEIAWQLGGAKAYARVKADDERATNPGDVLRELFVEHGPCMILIDEWVAYARQLHEQGDLPGGTFETQFTFAQALTESAKLAKKCLLVVSLPASDTAGSPHTQADDVEVGGIRGREALDRLRNVVGRVESSWRPASAEEGFEIVRRRLFKSLEGTDAFKQRNVTARAFSELYNSQSAEFPPECRDAEYEKRIQAAYPIHPEIFDRLYNDWSTLVKFQRTRGVLRLMAAVIHSLWEKGDKNAMILPCTIPIDDPRVQSELTRYLSDNWAPIIEKDVDGPNSSPMKLDSEQPNLGKLNAARRVARTVYLGSAPTSTAAHRGIEDRRVKLGCVMPGESPAIFGDALRRLATTATYLYQDGPRTWYATQPTVAKLAEDRAEQLKRDPDKIAAELDARIRRDVLNTGDFARVHPMPRSGGDVQDDSDARLVVLPIEAPYSKETNNAAESAARQIFESRGNSPRLYQNALVFLAADKPRLQDLEDAVRKYLAWSSILAEKIELNLDPHQQRQAETQRKATDDAVTARVPETYQWMLVPEQRTPQSEIVWTAIRLSGSDPLAVRASKKLRNAELLVPSLAPSILRKHMDDVPLWAGSHVVIRQLSEHFGRYVYLPRLANSAVLVRAIVDGIRSFAWLQDSFAYADGYDDVKRRYQGLVVAENLTIASDSPALLVKADVAHAQRQAETPLAAPSPPTPGSGSVSDVPTASGTANRPATHAPVEDAEPWCFHATAPLDPNRAGRDAGRISEEILAHLISIAGAEVNVTLHITAKVPNPSNALLRTVTENCRTLKVDLRDD